MRIEDVLVHLLALATGVVLFIGLAHALDGSPQRRRLRARISRHVPLEDLHVPLSERRALAARSIMVEPIRRPAPERWAERSIVEEGLRSREQAIGQGPEAAPVPAQLELATEQPERPSPSVASADATASEVAEAEPVIETSQPESQLIPSKAQEIQARVSALIDRQQFARGLALAKEALGRHDGSNSEREALSDMLWASAAGEVGRLIGQAVRNGARGAGGSERALARMDEAEAVVDAVPGSVLTSARRQDVGRRLWWGYMKLGTDRLDAGDLDGAIEPLFRALRLGELDPERQIETRQSLARAVEGLVDQLGSASLERLREGDFNGALAESRRLSQVVDGGLERGLSQEDLAGAIGRRHEVLTQIASS